MNKNLLMLLGVATAASLGMAALVKSQVAPSADTVQILMTRSELPAGSTVQPTDFSWSAWPEASVPPGAILLQPGRLEELEGLRVRRGLLKGEIVLESSLVDKGEAGFLAAKLESGKRAVAVPVSAESSVGGFVRPGDLVDILLTYEVQVGGQEERDAVGSMVSRHASETVLSKVRILAVDQEIKDTEEGTNKSARTVTVEVTSAQAEMLALAQQMGDLSLSLRGIGDDGEKRTTEFTTDTQVGRALRAVMDRTTSHARLQAQIQAQAIAQAALQAGLNRPPEVQRRTVRVFHGGASSDFKVQ